MMMPKIRDYVSISERYVTRRTWNNLAFGHSNDFIVRSFAQPKLMLVGESTTGGEKANIEQDFCFGRIQRHRGKERRGSAIENPDIFNIDLCTD
jgi:hypothetical protein